MRDEHEKAEIKELKEEVAVLEAEVEIIDLEEQAKVKKEPKRAKSCPRARRPNQRHDIPQAKTARIPLSPKPEGARRCWSYSQQQDVTTIAARSGPQHHALERDQ